MAATADSIRILSRALDQAGDVMARVKADQLAAPTPCSEWDVATLIGHLMADTQNFLATLRGEHADFTAAPERARAGWTTAFRSAADDLVHAWHQQTTGESPIDPDWQTAEFSVHTWDLATAIGVPVGDLDPEVAERGLAFMQANLTADRRGDAFGPEQEATGAGAYERLAAFAGRGWGT
jgi:uncharacterized protein (TIGR03086 family)